MTTHAEYQERKKLKRAKKRKASVWRRAKNELPVAKFGEGEPEPAVIKKSNGREICTKTAEGKAEYWERTKRMAIRQHWICACGCGEHMDYTESPFRETNLTFDHENGRGAGKRDDRIEVDGKWQNAAMKYLCNELKGSRRIPYAAHAVNHSELREANLL